MSTHGHSFAPLQFLLSWVRAARPPSLQLNCFYCSCRLFFFPGNKRMFGIFSALPDESAEEEPAFDPGFRHAPVARSRTNIHCFNT